MFYHSAHLPFSLCLSLSLSQSLSVSLSLSQSLSVSLSLSQSLSVSLSLSQSLSVSLSLFSPYPSRCLHLSPSLSFGASSQKKILSQNVRLGSNRTLNLHGKGVKCYVSQKNEALWENVGHHDMREQVVNQKKNEVVSKHSFYLWINS